MNAYLIPKNPNQILGESITNYQLSREDSLKIGRDTTKCQIVVNYDLCQTVSRIHVEIKPLKYPTTQKVVTWEIYDHSSNGTYINGIKLEGSRILQSGDIITLSQDGPAFVFDYIKENTESKIIDEPSLKLTQLVPILSKDNHIINKGFLVPGIITALFVVFLFFASNSVQFNIFLGTYIITISYYFIYRLCGKHKPWWLLIGVATVEMVILASPILLLFIFIFRGILPGGIPQNNLASTFVANFFGAGLMEELIKALPAFGLICLSSKLKSPWREKIGIWEPLDGILIVASAGAGFTFLETLGQYVPMVIAKGGELAGLQLLIPRTLGSIVGHMAYSGCFGYFIGLSMLKPSKRWILLLIGWLTAAGLHSLWNTAAIMSFNPLIGLFLLVLAGILAYTFLIAAILKARQLSPNRRENFATGFNRVSQ